MIRIISFIALFIATAYIPLCAQNPVCGSDQLRNLHQDSQFRNEIISNERIYNAIISRDKGQNSTGSVYTIPVVFHIMHNNGPENVPDSVIITAVEQLNTRYQNAAPYYDSTGHPINVQFCLATVDPSGNPTNGITRTVTPLTTFTFPGDDQPLKNLDRWSPDLYYNVWVVFNISGFIDGYAAFPMYAGQSIDGVVIEYSYITNNYLLAHETGHYCGLYHTFQYGCDNPNCLLNGDQVCDTPPDNSSTGFPCMTNSCSTEMQDTSGFNPFAGDVNELPNYMDYTTCPNSFTQGQADRIETAVSILRNNLFISNGCGSNPGQLAPVASFSFEVSGCYNGSVAFSDSLSQGAITSEWDFNNDGIFDTIAHNFSYTFPATGIYLVTQRVTGLGGQDTISQSITVQKGTTYNYPIISYPQSITDTLRVCEGELITFEGDSNGVSWLWSTGDITPTITIVADSSQDISLMMVDNSGFIWTTQCTPIYMMVYPFEVPVITYDDSLGYTCEGDLLHLYIADPISGTYTWHIYHISTGWFNTNDHNMFFEIYTDPTYGNQFYVTYTNPAGCTAQSNIIFVQPQHLPYFPNAQLTVNGFTLSYPLSTNTQYQWYNYNLPVPGATTNQYTVTSTGCYSLAAWNVQYPECESFTDTVCYFFTGETELSDNESRIYPIPATDYVEIEMDALLQNSSDLIIYNNMGEIMNISSKWTHKVPGKWKLDISDLSDGIYFIRSQQGVFQKPLRFVKITF